MTTNDEAPSGNEDKFYTEREVNDAIQHALRQNELQTAAGELRTAINRLSRDLRKSATEMTDREARFLVNSYYMLQENRIRSDAQMRSMRSSGVPHGVLLWLGTESRVLEQQVRGAIAKYIEGHTMGSWLLGIHGIGPVVAAGIVARIDITTMPTAGHMWAYCGLDPTKKWEKGKKRPWNPHLKRITMLAGDSFVKHKANENCIYGHIYDARKEYETAKNERLEYADQAREGLNRVGKNTEAYKWYEKNMLPPGRIHLRCVRYAVKMFLSHLHQVWWEREDWYACACAICCCASWAHAYRTATARGVAMLSVCTEWTVRAVQTMRAENTTRAVVEVCTEWSMRAENSMCTSGAMRANCNTCTEWTVRTACRMSTSPVV